MERLKADQQKQQALTTILFTFQYGEIKSSADGGSFSDYSHLHSSMERLKGKDYLGDKYIAKEFTFQYGEIKSRWSPLCISIILIYIPVWRD